MKNLSVVLLAVVLTTTAVGVESANNNNNKNERRLRGVNNRRRVQSLSPETIGGDNEEYQQPKPVDFFDTVDPATVQVSSQNVNYCTQPSKVACMVVVYCTKLTCVDVAHRGFEWP